MSIEGQTQLEKRVEALEKQVAELLRDKAQQDSYIRLEVAKAQRPQPRERIQAIVRPQGESQ